MNTYNAARLSLLSILAFLLLVRIKLIFSYSIDLDGAEFGFIHYAQLLLQHKPLYANPNAFPYLPVLFTPCYPYLISSLSNLFHLNYNNDIHQILVMARTLSFLFLFVNAYLIFKIFKLFKLPSIYFLAMFTFYVLLITGHFFATRPDALKTTAFTLFLYAVIQYSFFLS